MQDEERSTGNGPKACEEEARRVILILVESDLLLAAMKNEDKLKQMAEKILEGVDSGRLKGVYASVSAIQEIVFWFYNRQLFHEMVQAVNGLTHLKNLEWIELTPEICLTASMLMDEHRVSPFDAYHAATAISRYKTILSTEHVYDQIDGIERIDPKEFVKF